jgi:hypothetical protein
MGYKFQVSHDIGGDTKREITQGIFRTGRDNVVIQYELF